MSDEMDLLDWMVDVRAEQPEAVVVDGEWSNHDEMHALHERAGELRNRRDDADWKQPFNRFRGIFLKRHELALLHFAEGTGDDAFWLAWDHHAFEPEA